MKKFLLLCLSCLLVGTSALADTSSQATGPSTLLTYLQADKLQTAGLTGKNIKLGIIANGVEGLSQFQQAGILPQNIGLADAAEGSGQNGIGMLQVAHLLAPDAQLYFCAAPAASPLTPESAAPVATCLGKLIDQFGVNIVATDLEGQAGFYPTQETLQTEALLEAHPDVLLLAASGDNGRNYYQATFTPTTLTLPAISGIPAGNYTVQDFGASLGRTSDSHETVVIPPNQSLTVCWSSSGTPPQAANETNSNNNLMAIWYLDNQGNPIIASESYLDKCDNQIISNNESSPEVVNLVFGIAQQQNSNPFSIRLELSLSNISGDGSSPSTLSNMNYTTGGGAGGEIGLAGRAVVVGASALGTDGVSAYSQSSPAESFYSATATGTNNSAGFPEYLYTLLGAPQIPQTPALMGEDTIPSSLLQGYKGSYYSGDAPSVASVAGVAAQLMQAGLSRDQIVTDLEQSAAPLLVDQGGNPISQSQGAWNPADGYGLVQGYAALKHSGLAIPQPVITAPAGNMAVNVGQPVNFAGNCTVANGESITGYHWDILLNGVSQGTSDAQSPGNLALQKSGPYLVTFNCTASNGLMSGEPASVLIQVNGSGSGSGGGGLNWLILAGLGLCLILRPKINTVMDSAVGA